MDSAIDIPTLLGMGFPIQRSPAQYLLSGSPKLIAANHVFLRHPAPRHPPLALSSLAIIMYLFLRRSFNLFAILLSKNKGRKLYNMRNLRPYSIKDHKLATTNLETDAGERDALALRLSTAHPN